MNSDKFSPLNGPDKVQFKGSTPMYKKNSEGQNFKLLFSLQFCGMCNLNHIWLQKNITSSHS